MEVKYKYRGPDKPMGKCLDYAWEHGYTLTREPFGKRGSLIEASLNGTKIGHRTSYQGVLNMMQKYNNSINGQKQPRIIR